MPIPPANPSKIFTGMGIAEHPKDESIKDGIPVPYHIQTGLDNAAIIKQLQDEYKRTGEVTPITRETESKA